MHINVNRIKTIALSLSMAAVFYICPVSVNAAVHPVISDSQKDTTVIQASDGKDIVAENSSIGNVSKIETKPSLVDKVGNSEIIVKSSKLPTGITVEANEVGVTPSQEKAIGSNAADDSTLNTVAAYDISLIKSGKEYEPGVNNVKDVTVQITNINTGNEAPIIVHKHDDGTTEIVPSIYDPDTNIVQFQTDSFSIYYVEGHFTESETVQVRTGGIVSTTTDQDDFLKNWTFEFDQTETTFNDGRPTYLYLRKFIGKDAGDIDVPATMTIQYKNVDGGWTYYKSLTIPVAVRPFVASYEDGDFRKLFDIDASCNSLTFEPGVIFGEGAWYCNSDSPAYPSYGNVAPAAKTKSWVNGLFYKAKVKSITIKGSDLVSTNTFQKSPVQNLDINLTKSLGFGCYSFNECTNLKNVKLASSNPITIVDSMFSCCHDINLIDMSGLKVTDDSNLNYMFDSTYNLTEIKFWSNICKTVKLKGIFRNSSITDAQMNDFLTHVYFNTGTSISWMFQSCPHLQYVDLSGRTDLNNVYSIKEMFSGCPKLTTVKFPATPFFSGLRDGSDWEGGSNGSYSVFDGDSELVHITNLNYWAGGTSSNYSGWFSGCTKLNEADLSGFTNANISNASSMFKGCSSMQSINISKMNAAKIGSADGMFSGCNILQKIYVPIGTTKSGITLPDTYVRIDNGVENKAYLYSSLPTASATSFLIRRYNGSSIYEGTIPIKDLNFWKTPMKRVYIGETCIWSSVL